MNRLHIEGMPENKSNPFLLTEVREPIPGKNTLDADDHVVAIRYDDPQKCFRGRRQILMNQLRAILIKNTDVHRLRMEIDPAIMFMLPCVEIHPGILLGDGLLWYSHPTAATRSKGGLDEYQSAPPHRRPIAVPTEREGSRPGGGPRRQALASLFAVLQQV